MKTKLMHSLSIPEDKNPYGFIGRSQEILDLLDFLIIEQNTIVVHGPIGIGKTSLIQKVTERIDSINTFNIPIIWFSFPEIYSSEYLFNCLHCVIDNQTFPYQPNLQKRHDIADHYYKTPHLIVFDNLNVLPESDNHPAYHSYMTRDDMNEIMTFLETINGGKTKFFITTDTLHDSQINHSCCHYYELKGLKNKELEELSSTILEKNSIDFYNKDKNYIKLLKELNGNPLAMRIILPRLECQSPKAILEELSLNTKYVHMDLVENNNSPNIRMYSIIRLIENDFTDEMKILLIPFSFYSGLVETDLMESIIDFEAHLLPDINIDSSLIRFVIDKLHHIGLLKRFLPNTQTFYIHPVLTAYLKDTLIDKYPQKTLDSCASGFVYILSRLADSMSDLDNSGKCLWFHFNRPSFLHALHYAKELDMEHHEIILLKALTEFSITSSNLKDANHILSQLEELFSLSKQKDNLAITCYQKSRIMFEQKNYNGAEVYYKKSLTLFEELKTMNAIAAINKQLGKIAEKQGKLNEAKQLYLKAIDVFNEINDRHGAASTYQKLAKIVHDQQDYSSAELWCQKSLPIFEEYEDEYNSAKIYHQLASIALARRELETAKEWYQKAKDTFEKYDDESELASVYQQFGEIAQQERDFETAEQWFNKTEKIFNKTGNKDGLAQIYQKNGMIAQERKDYEGALKWYKKALKLNQQFKSSSGIAHITYLLSVLKGLQGHYEESASLIIKSLIAFNECNDEENIRRNIQNFKITYYYAKSEEQERLKELWEKQIGNFNLVISR